MNNIVIHGRLTRDPELKEYRNGKGETGKYALFSVAVNRDIGDETDFFSCTAFGRSGEALAKWLHKGDGIVLSGSMQSRKKDEKVYWSIRVDRWDFAEKKAAGTDSTGEPLPDSMETIEEDVPF